MLFDRAVVDLSRPTLNYLAGVIRRHRKAIGSAWRLLNAGQQALLVLTHLRKCDTFTQLGAGFEISTSTAWRYVQEAVELLSARSPKPATSGKARQDGLRLLVLDDTLIACDQVRADRPYYSAKRRCHGMNVQVLAGPDGMILWTSGAMPVRTHDLIVARVGRHRKMAERTMSWPNGGIRSSDGVSPSALARSPGPDRGGCRALDRVIWDWLRACAACDQGGWQFALDGKDLHGSWSDEGRISAAVSGNFGHGAPGTVVASGVGFATETAM